jgi:hypothetical protein
MATQDFTPLFRTTITAGTFVPLRHNAQGAIDHQADAQRAA